MAVGGLFSSSNRLDADVVDVQTSDPVVWFSKMTMDSSSSGGWNGKENVADVPPQRQTH